MFGRDRNPTALITALTRQVRGPSGCCAVISHRWSASSQTIEVTSV